MPLQATFEARQDRWSGFWVVVMVKGGSAGVSREEAQAEADRYNAEDREDRRPLPLAA